MKVLRYLSFILFYICINYTNSYSQDRRDGNWWNKLADNSKEDYITGFFDGMELGYSFSYWGFLDNDKPNDCVSAIMKSYYDYSKKYFKNVSNIQLADGLNEFFLDYRNRRIRIEGAIWLVVNTIAGTSKEEIDILIENWRKYAND